MQEDNGKARHGPWHGWQGLGARSEAELMRVEVKPELLRWAVNRAGIGALDARFPKLASWISGEAKPTLKQLEDFANAAHLPLGYLFLQAPPIERLPIPDFRTAGNEYISHPSPDLLDTIYACQQRQDWYREFMQFTGEDPPPFVGSMTVKSRIETAASRIRTALNFNLEERYSFASWGEAARRFIDQAESLGILVMVNGIVGNNTSRKLNPEEFRGFALVDDLAPTIFINGADTKAAQMFTLAHELAHVWLGASAISDAAVISSPSNDAEKWCNQVAAELLVPLETVREEYRKDASLRSELDRLARRFKVSTLVVLRRIYDAGGITREEYWAAYRRELALLRKMIKESDGGDFYPTHALRVGHRFARALVASTLEGQTLYRDAFRMLGISKLATFQEIGRKLRVAY
jgi:Zn-dependent peptidase ImmA (M78 family)